MSSPESQGGAETLSAWRRDERATCARAASSARTRGLRRLTAWLVLVMADDAMSERSATERRRDDELVRRIERRRRS